MADAITSILSSVGDLLSTLYTSVGSGDTVSTLGTIAMLPIVSGVVGILISVVRRGRG